MKPTTRNTYANTDKQKVLNFVQSLAPTPAEAPYLACILKKSGLSMRDARLLLEYVARRASEHPLERDAIATLGLPSLPASAAAQSAV